MRLLVDTHVLLWYLEGDKKLSTTYRRLISDPENEKFVSVGSLWEIAIKSSLNKLSLSNSLKDIIEYIETRGIILLSISPRHTIEVSTLPFHHRDPFDRILIAQSRIEELPIITDDRMFADYEVELA
jgi:PIN domain nuclease of toxin-antitoxin system